MSVKGIFSKGIPTNPNASATKVLKYLPRPRSPMRPSTFRRENVEEATLKQHWAQGRLDGGQEIRNYYNPAPSLQVNDTEAKLIPKRELEKFMPNIYLGPKAYVTPVTLMSARDGQRVTHDLIHSYDSFIGGRGGWLAENQVDHDNIHPLDPKFAGLHTDAIGCRARIYRWLRRGPQSEEYNYFKRHVQQKSLAEEGAKKEAGLYRKIIRLAKKGKLKEACEAYRTAEFVPPVEVYRALVAACVPGAFLADAIQIYQDGDKLIYKSRDHEVFHSLMECAVRAENVPRVMWVFDQMLGTKKVRDFSKVLIDPLWQYQIACRGLSFVLDRGCRNEAMTFYRFLVDSNLIDFDLEVQRGVDVRALLEAGKPVDLAALPTSGLKLSKDLATALPTMAIQVYKSLSAESQALHAPPPGSDPSVQWLLSYYSDLNVQALLRLARYQGGADLMAARPQQYIDRAVEWLRTLSSRTLLEGRPLPYLLKSHPSHASANLRVVALPKSVTELRTKPATVTPTEAGARFFYDPNMSAVEETYPAMSNTLESRMLARQPIHRALPPALNWATLLQDSQALTSATTAQQTSRILHPSLLKLSAEAAKKAVEADGKAPTGAPVNTVATPSSASDSPTSTPRPEDLFQESAGQTRHFS
jgi:hypothetical protein